MAAITALDLITASLKRLGVLAGIETPSADLAADSLARLNDLIESWASESLTPWLDTAVGGAVLTTVFDLPPGYHRALRDALAIELAPEVGRQIDPVLLQVATDAKAQLQRVNFRPMELRVDEALLGDEYGGYDWRNDE